MSAEAEVKRRIAARGSITFAEFMELALYWPTDGYYASKDPIGGHGDYYTSPLAHPAFGALLAVQLFQVWQLMGQPAPFTLVELGAGNGLLCRDILAAARELPGGFSEFLSYVCIDRRNATGLEGRDGQAHRLVAAGAPLRGIRGCVLSNELLDSFPVHQVIIEGGRLREVYVASGNDKLVFSTGEPSTPALERRLEGLGVTLAEGQVAEINLGLEAWLDEVSAALDQGFVLSIDYGREAADLYSAEDRFRGTLTTFYQHLQTDAPLERVGRQDITAQVDFTSLVDYGRKTGLRPLGLTTQREFLHNLGAPELSALMARASGTRREIQANRAGSLELVKPGGLGDFKALVQAKNIPEATRGPGLFGFARNEAVRELVGSLSPPRLTPDHLDLVGDRPHEFEIAIDDLWPGGDQPPSTAPRD